MNLDLNNMAILAIALTNAFTAIMVWRTHQISKKTELNTNSMKDALVAATKVASHAEGMEEGRKAGEEKAATLAKGVLIGKRDLK